LIINKTDLAPHVGADLAVMARDAKKQRGERPFIFTNLRSGSGVAEVIEFIRTQGLLDEARAARH
jgi:urease accessory protein